jgi:hypothetical protein
MSNLWRILIVALTALILLPVGRIGLACTACGWSGFADWLGFDGPGR